MSILMFVGTYIIVHKRVLVKTKEREEVLFGELIQIY